MASRAWVTTPRSPASSRCSRWPWRRPRPYWLATAVTEITAAAGTPYTFERRQESPAEAILHAAGLCAAAEPAQIPILVTGRSHHATHQIIGSVPVRLLHQSPYPVLTIA
jgi:nucleotide-binding universal stress UspA family protein